MKAARLTLAIAAALIVLALAGPAPRATTVDLVEIGSALSCEAVTDSAGEIVDVVCVEVSE
jgi:hypothetical protein